MRNYLKILFLLLVPISGMAQHYTDSLKKVLKNADADSTRYSALSGIGEYYVEINLDTSLKYLNPALVIAQKNGRDVNQAITLARIGYVLIYQNKYAESLKYFQQALTLVDDPANGNSIWNPNMGWMQFSGRQKSRLTLSAGVHLLYAILLGKVGEYEQSIVHLKIGKELAKQ